MRRLGKNADRICFAADECREQFLVVRHFGRLLVVGSFVSLFVCWSARAPVRAYSDNRHRRHRRRQPGQNGGDVTGRVAAALATAAARRPVQARAFQLDVSHHYSTIQLLDLLNRSEFHLHIHVCFFFFFR